MHLRIGIHQDPYLGIGELYSRGLVIFKDMNSNILVCQTITENVFFEMPFLFLIPGCIELYCCLVHCFV